MNDQPNKSFTKPTTAPSVPEIMDAWLQGEKPLAGAPEVFFDPMADYHPFAPPTIAVIGSPGLGRDVRR